jgi:hypothetical protein
MTLSWKLPLAPAIVTVAWLPITWAQTMQTASGTTGLTLPGMIELPGCSAGSSISPRPANGPEFIQRRSLPIFMSATASTLSWPDSSTAPSCEAIPSNRFLACSNRVPDSFDSDAATRLPKRGSALMPVPTAVPPIGSRRRRWRLSSMRSEAEASCADHAPSSCARVSGIASIRWVRPVLTTRPRLFARRSMVERRCSSAGSRSSLQASTAATWIAVGMTSLELCPMLTWSFACTGFFKPRVARLAMTSFAFMLLEVPEPVWKTSTGN